MGASTRFLPSMLTWMRRPESNASEDFTRAASSAVAAYGIEWEPSQFCWVME
jgi:hypothetical protein